MKQSAQAAGFSGHNDLPSLGSADWQEISQHAEIVFSRLLQELARDKTPSEVYFGISPAEAVALHTQYAQETAGDLTRGIEGLSGLSEAQLGALMHLENVRGLLETGAHVMAERNQLNGHSAAEVFERPMRRQKIEQMLQTMKDRGFDQEKTAFMLSNIKLWPTLTPHPTKEKNENGAKFFADIIRLAEETPASERNQKFEQIIGDMLRTRLTPAKKDELDDETATALHHEDTYIKGMLDYLEDLQDSLTTIYGDQAIDLMDLSVHLDVAARDWYAGDADGKPVPATALFAKRLLSAEMAVARNIEILRSAGTDAQGHNPLDEITAVFERFQQGLATLSRDVESIKKLDSSSKEFQAIKDQFVSVFTGTSYRGKTYHTGPLLTRDIMDDLRIMAREDEDPGIRRAARRVVLRHNQNGMAMGRQEIRHNSRDLKTIFDNFYAHMQEKHPEVIAELLGDVPVKKLNAEAETVFLKRLFEKHGENLNAWFMEANPGGWPREILERFHLITQCYNQNRMGAAIIAEAQPLSVVQQQVLADAMGLKNLVHVALNEDRLAMERAAENLALYSHHFGRSSVERRTQDLPGKEAAPHSYLCVMMPQSDSQKQHGPFIRDIQRQARRELIHLAHRNGHAVLEKTGTGMDPARGGMSPLAVPRIMLSTISGLRLHDQAQKELLMQSLGYVSITQQGRDPGIRLATPAQVYDMISGVVQEISAACMVVNGNLDIDAVAPRAAHHAVDVAEILFELSKDASTEYDSMRTRQSLQTQLGRNRMDSYLAEVSALKVAEMANVGARKDARTDKPKEMLAGTFNEARHTGFCAVDKKPVSTLRAIGSAMAVANSRTYFDNYYTLGLFLEGLHQAYQDKELSQEDVQKIWNDPFYMQQIMPNALVGLARADFKYGFDKISGTPGTWTVERILTASQENWHDNGQRMSDNLGFHAVLCLDALKATALLESLAVTATGKRGVGFDSSVEEIIGALYDRDDQLNVLQFGTETRKKYPLIDEISQRAKKTNLSRAIVHQVEGRLETGQIDFEAPGTGGFLHHIACAARTAEGPANIEILMDRGGFGSRPDRMPVFDLIAKPSHIYQHEMDLKLGQGL